MKNLISLCVQYGMPVVPVIAILTDKSAFTPVLNASEVEAMFDVPLEMFLKVMHPFTYSN